MKVRRIRKSCTAAAMVFVLTITVPVFASQEQAHHGEESGEIQQEETRRPPSVLYVQWAGLLIILGVGGHYLFSCLKKKAVHEESRATAYILTLAALAILSLNYHPAVKEFDEPPVFGFIKFIAALASAGMLTFYGVLGRHDEHQEEENTPGDRE